MTIERFKRPNFFDFQKVTLEDLNAEQSFHSLTTGAAINAVAGSGVLLDFPEERVIFDSDSMDEYQAGLVAIDAFDGQGTLEEPYTTTDQQGGNQLAVTLSDASVGGAVVAKVFIIGKTFDDSLVYEVLTFRKNITEITKNHFKEVTNILFQNFRGNENTLVDGYGCLDVGGRIVVTEASSFLLGRDPIIAEQILEPNLDFRFFKTASSGTTLENTLIAAIGSSNDVDDLDINTTAALTREFEEGGSTAIIYGQKFKMRGDNIQKVSLALRLESGSTFSGTLVVGLRRLQTSETSTSDFLPDSDIGFDPDVESLEEIAVDVDDLEEMGIVLNDEPQVVDFLFTGSNLSNPQLSELVEDEYYVLTVRRTGSVTTGTIILDEARNSDVDLRLTVFESGVWTDIEDSSLWFRVWGDSLRLVNGIVYDNGIRVSAPKTELNESGVLVQSYIEDIDLYNTGEDAENYVVVEAGEEFSDIKAHPRVGDPQYTRVSDGPLVSVLSQDDLGTLLDSKPNAVILGRVRDRNSRSNPTITGTFDRPGLALGNTITIFSPGSDLLTQNVVGSVITPNVLKPTLKYRITSQETYTDIYGDLNGDGVIDILDQARMVLLDGYGTDLSSGSRSDSEQLQALLAGNITIDELQRADVSDDIEITEADDGYHLNEYISYGYAMPAGSSYTRMVLTVEPLLDSIAYYNEDAESTLELQEEDPDLIDNSSYTEVDYQIDFVPTWYPDNIEILDLRRYIATTFLDFSLDDLTATNESGGTNSLFVPGDMYLSGSVKELNGDFHPLDFEQNTIEIELPAGDTEGEINIFTTCVVEKMQFSDGTYVAATALNNNQVKFEVSISSYAKDMDGYDIDDGYTTIDEVIGTYIDHDTGLLRISAKNVVHHELYPQNRTRLQITVSLKQAGFTNNVVFITASELSTLLE